jgi:hypothetical protein
MNLGGVMFCKKCAVKLDDNFKYCPYCGDKMSRSAISIISSNTYKTGDKGPSGGYIFYDKGNYSDGWRYLEAAPKDVKSGWGATGSLNIITSKELGAGKNNTDRIVSCLKDTAVKLCSIYTFNDFQDWFLPSEEELELMYQNLKKNSIGDFSDERYWTSTQIEQIDEEHSIEYDEAFEDGNEIFYDTIQEPRRTYFTMMQDFRTGVHLVAGKFVTDRSRPIRFF